MDTIRSAQNQRVKLIKSLNDKKGRREHSSYIAEGYNMLKDMPKGMPCELYVRESDIEKYAAFIQERGLPCTALVDTVFDGVSGTVHSGGILGVIKMPEEKPISGNFVLVADGIRDAGNFGTIIRTAVAMGITDIVNIDGVDVYNPKTVRAAMGGVFHVNAIERDRREEISALLNGYRIAALDMAGHDLFHYSAPEKLALVVGGEAQGVSEELMRLSDDILSIPMPGGRTESLNAAVSISIAIAVLTHGKS